MSGFFRLVVRHSQAKKVAKSLVNQAPNRVKTALRYCLWHKGFRAFFIPQTQGCRAYDSKRKNLMQKV